MSSQSYEQFPSSGGGGGGASFLGSHFLGRSLRDIEDMTIRAPAGFVALAKGLYNDPLATLEAQGKGFLTTFEHPLRDPVFTLANLALGAGTYGAIAGRLGEAGRVAAAAGQAGVTADEAAAAASALRPTIAQALLRGPKPEARVLTLPRVNSTALFARGLTDEEPLMRAGYGSFVKNPAMKLLSKGVDQLHETYPNLHVPGLFRSQAKRIEKANWADNVMIRRNVRALPAKFVAQWKGLSNPEFVAGHVAAELVPIDTRIAKHTEWMNTEGFPQNLKNESARQIKLLEEAKQYVQNVKVTDPTTGTTHTIAQIKPEYPKLQQFVDEMRNLSTTREHAAISFGLLTNASHPYDAAIIKEHGYIPEGTLTASVINRRLGPWNVFHGNALSETPQDIESQLNKQVALDNARPGNEPSPRQVELRSRLANYETQGEQSPWLAEQAFRVPYKITPSIKSLAGGTFRYTGAEPKKPGTLTHPFKAGILRYGGGRLDLAHVMAEDYLEMERYLYLKAMRDRVEKAAVDDPNLIDPAYRQQIRVRVPGGEVPPYLQLANDMLNQRVDEMPKEELKTHLQGATKLFEKIRDYFIPEANNLPADTPGLKYIDKRLLAGLDKPNPLLSAFDFPLTRAVVHFMDAANEGNKAAILYAKPSYALPNLLGNVGLALLQQGFFAPRNLYRSTVAVRKYAPDVRHGILTNMGGGLTQILEPEIGAKFGFGRARNIIHKTSSKLANAYGTVVDDPMRFSSFLHEASDAGFNIKSNEVMRDLLNNPDRARDLELIRNRANDALINYERLGPGEQAILRRMIFFYPWVKGSTRYAYQFTMAHPIATGVTAEAAKTGREQQEKMFGELPSWAEGLIPWGAPNRQGYVPSINPSSVSIFQTPGTLLEEMQQLFRTHPNPNLALWNEFSPFDRATLNAITLNQLDKSKFARGHDPLTTAFHNYWQGVPLYNLYQQFLAGRYGFPGQGRRGEFPTHAYPHDTTLGSLYRYLFTGGLTNRLYNPAAGQYQAYLETSGRG